jgi:hypothetical protein
MHVVHPLSASDQMVTKTPVVAILPTAGFELSALLLVGSWSLLPQVQVRLLGLEHVCSARNTYRDPVCVATCCTRLYPRICMTWILF